MKVRESCRVGVDLDQSHDRKCGAEGGSATEMVQDQDQYQVLDQDIQDVCDRSGTVVRCAGGVRVKEDPHQGSVEALSCCYGDEQADKVHVCR